MIMHLKGAEHDAENENYEDSRAKIEAVRSVIIKRKSDQINE